MNTGTRRFGSSADKDKKYTSATKNTKKIKSPTTCSLAKCEICCMLCLGMVFRYVGFCFYTYMMRNQRHCYHFNLQHF